MKERAHEIALNPKNDGYQRGLASMVSKNFHKKTGSEAIATSTVGANVNEALAQVIKKFKPVIKKFKARKVNARFQDNIWSVDLVF